MNHVYLWAVTAVTLAIAINTVFRLWTERNRFASEDLHDEDRLFVWRVVLFLIHPMLVAFDMNWTMSLFDGMHAPISSWAYGFYWYSYALPQDIPALALTVGLFIGVFFQILLALCLVAALFFRPHPFMCTLLGYSVVWIFAYNLVVEPAFAALGIGGTRWQIAIHQLPRTELSLVFAAYALLAGVFAFCMTNRRLRVWFAQLSRPAVATQLRAAQAMCQIDPRNAAAAARLTLLYERAGLRRHAKAHWRKLHTMYPRSIYSAFVDAMLCYRQRKYNLARQQFLYAADCPNVDPALRGALLAAAGCAAFADGDHIGALNLSERALEFDDASLIARMVKVDVFLHQGKKEQAGEEIISALRRGFDVDLERNIPIDTEFVLQRIGRMRDQERARKAAARGGLV